MSLASRVPIALRKYSFVVFVFAQVGCDDETASTDDRVEETASTDDGGDKAASTKDRADAANKVSPLDASAPIARDAAGDHDAVLTVDAGTERTVPVPPPYAIQVPAYPQPEGDPKKGYDYLINGEYMRLGASLAAMKATQPELGPADQVPGRRGDNDGLMYTFNAVTGDDGERLAAVNCISCHSTPLQGKLVMGLGRPNRLMKLDGFNPVGLALVDPVSGLSSLPTLLSRFGGIVNGTIDVFPYIASHRDPKTLVWSDEERFPSNVDVLGWVDIPAWWRMKKKHGMYATGAGRGDHRNHMSFASMFSVKSVEEAAEIEKNFSDVSAYLRTLEAPKYPGKINQDLAAKGEVVFVAACATCHGTYGEDWTFPNVIIPYEKVGTEPSLAMSNWLDPVVDWYRESWYARNKDTWIESTKGYYAPPLDGVWATAPYFHNGSVPTLDGVIDPKKRLAVWTTNMSEDDFDLEKVGWMDKEGDFDLTVDLDLGRFDSSKPGNSNQGHTYGAHFDEADQKALLEYLKTL